MLVYSKTVGFRHTASIDTGQAMLSDIATEQGFDVVFADTNDEFTVDGLSQYEIVFFLNTSGDVFTDTEQESYEEWMTAHHGAFAGVHSATDTENGWAFYSEITGQYFDLHEACCSEAEIEWDAAALDHVAVQGLPNPWSRSEEWFRFDRAAEWSTKAGFQILGRVTSNGATQPVSYIREWGNFRSFYTSLGHEASVFEDADVKQHVAAGILWAVRREHQLVQ
jgi:type 1 glutamine amidotransferase